MFLSIGDNGNRLKTLGGLIEALNEYLKQGFPPETKIDVCAAEEMSGTPISMVIGEEDGITIYQ
nr:MAG TPA: hypothetical protein [Crassvirales sp.]